MRLEAIPNVLYSTVYQRKNTIRNEAAVDGMYPTNNSDPLQTRSTAPEPNKT